MDTSPQIGQLVTTDSGLAVARVQMQNIVINPCNNEDGSAFVNVQDGDRIVMFLLDRNQRRHLARLLLGERVDEPSGITAVAEAR